jgi:hypothetical protein
LRINGRFLVVCVDATLLAAILLLAAVHLTGLRVHEWLGIAFVLLMLVHLLYSWRWITTHTKRIFSGGSRRARINYLLNVTLFVIVMIVVISGLVISQAALPNLGIATIDDRTWRALHNESQTWALVAVGVHVAMNWTWIRAALRRGWAALRRASRGPQLAPSLWYALRRSAVIAMATCVIAGGLWLAVGSPSRQREVRLNEMARWNVQPGPGLGQMLTRGALLAIAGFAARRWLRVHI